jgi:hypothetical protein
VSEFDFLPDLSSIPTMEELLQAIPAGNYVMEVGDIGFRRNEEGLPNVHVKLVAVESDAPEVVGRSIYTDFYTRRWKSKGNKMAGMEGPNTMMLAGFRDFLVSFQTFTLEPAAISQVLSKVFAPGPNWETEGDIWALEMRQQGKQFPMVPNEEKTDILKAMVGHKGKVKVSVRDRVYEGQKRKQNGFLFLKPGV